MFTSRQVKRNMWRALDVRMRALLAAGRHVVLAGDFNVVLPWWGEHGPRRGSGLHKRTHSITISTTPTATASQHGQQQAQQQQPQQDKQLEAVTPSDKEPDKVQVTGSAMQPGLQDCVQELHSSQQGVAAVQVQVQEQCAAVEQAEPQQDQMPRSSPAVSKEDNFAPHAHFRRGKVGHADQNTQAWV